MMDREDGSIRHSSNGIYLYCSVCCDILGNPKKINRKGMQRHLRSSEHQQRKRKLQNKPKYGDIAHEEKASKQPNQTIPSANYYNYTLESSNSAPHEKAPTMFDSESNLEKERLVYTDGFPRVDDLFAASREHQTPLGSELGEDISQDSCTDSTSDSAEEREPAYSFNFGQFSTTSRDGNWHPWPSKSIFLADLITNSKHLKFSRRQTYALLAYARETGGRDIPSYKTLRKTQKKLRTLLGDLTVHKVSSVGNVYYLNRVTAGLAQDIANPHLRKHMTFYPHLNGKQMSQLWHSNKLLRGVPDHVLTPTIRHQNRIYYVGELVQRSQGWFLPLQWILKGERCEMYAVGHKVEETPAGLHVCCNHRIAVPVATFCQSFTELLERDSIPLFDDESQGFRARMPHPLRGQAGSRLVYSIPVISFMDDVSGNITNQWNKHISSYISNSTLTQEVLNSEYSVRFVLTSKHASPSELMQGIREDLEDSFQNPFFQQQTTQCKPSSVAASCRTPTSFAGPAVESGYITLFQAGDKRTPVQTRERVNALLDLSIQPAQKTHIKDLACDWGVKDSLGQLFIDRMLEIGQKMQESRSHSRQTGSDVTSALQLELDSIHRQGSLNAFLDMDYFGFNAHEDTPTEILHTVLLGVVKYFWGQTVFILSKAQMRTLEARLGSLNIAGLNINSISEHYMCQYTGSLVGKHFKTLAQLMPFACYDLVEANLLEVWLLLGRLTNLLWLTEIEDIDAYVAELQVVIDDFLLAAARCSPSIIVQKPKFHFLVHLPMYIQRFGPAILFSTERFESFHGVFRTGSLFSNRQAPSRDIAEYFVGLDRLKHVCSGGYWKDGMSWVRASSFVREFVEDHTEFSTLLGLPSDTRKVSALPSVGPGPRENTYFHILSTHSHISDLVIVGSNVLLQAKRFGQVKALFGCVSPNGTTTYHASIREYQVSAQKHGILDMPVLELVGDLVCTPIQSIVCVVNLQHDCLAEGTCTLQPIAERQEREDTSRTRNMVQHSDNPRYMLNTQGLHGIQHVRFALPQSLLAWRGLGVDPGTVRSEAVTKLASAATNKQLQMEARRAAKEAFKSAVEGQPTDSEVEQRSAKRQ
ncbi:hypothetical protein FRC06_000726 [Ceratobasidium sp. 370]|nr:hypothetical protein FRC06_000726 [Ceratobasidium sp. 370]